mgnify:CR=1 FL=1|tara:strand:- start:2045 stop:2239 length:195 start_codon:yes stop_codon:yes gene_type:complete
MKLFANPNFWKVEITMEKVKFVNPVVEQFSNSNEASKPSLFVLKSIAASFAGASIPAAIFYFMM